MREILEVKRMVNTSKNTFPIFRALNLIIFHYANILNGPPDIHCSIFDCYKLSKREKLPCFVLLKSKEATGFYRALELLCWDFFHKWSITKVLGLSILSFGSYIWQNINLMRKVTRRLILFFPRKTDFERVLERTFSFANFILLEI